MPKPNKSKGNDTKLRQSLMGEFVSKSEKAKKQKQASAQGSSDLEDGGAKKKRRNMFTFRSFWTRGSDRDTKEYRDGYPGKEDYDHLDENRAFYMNERPSRPDGDFIDNIHMNWWGDYKLLERHHGYIQWLFPIRDTGMNWHAQELQVHEIEKIKRSRKSTKRVLSSYKMMLDFYGMKLDNEDDGKIERAENYRERFRHLNSSFHNYLRITRILKSLGELGYEHLKANLVKFILYEGIAEDNLPNCIESCVKYWIGVLRVDTERDDVYKYLDELREKYVGESTRGRRSPSPTYRYVDTKPKVKATKANVTKIKRQDEDDDLSEDDTLAYAMSLVDSDDGLDDGKDKSRKDHEMSDSDNDEEFQTPDVVMESQEASYWKHDMGGSDGDSGKHDKGEENIELGSEEIEPTVTETGDAVDTGDKQEGTSRNNSHSGDKKEEENGTTVSQNQKDVTEDVDDKRDNTDDCKSKSENELRSSKVDTQKESDVSDEMQDVVESKTGEIEFSQSNPSIPESKVEPPESETTSVDEKVRLQTDGMDVNVQGHATAPESSGSVENDIDMDTEDNRLGMT